MARIYFLDQDTKQNIVSSFESNIVPRIDELVSIREQLSIKEYTVRDVIHTYKKETGWTVISSIDVYLEFRHQTNL